MNHQIKLLALFAIAWMFPALCIANAPKPPTSQPVYIRNSVDLAKLPNQLANRVVYIAPGAYDFTPKLIEWQNVLIVAQDVNRPPCLRVAAKDAGRWAFNSDGKTSNVEIRNVHVDLPTNHGGFLHVYGGDQIRIVGCSQNEGNVLWSEGRAGRLYIKGHLPGGPADKYEICTFTSPVTELIVDERGANAWFIQGKSEACIRDMQSIHSVWLGLNVTGSKFKQSFQDRAGGTHEHIGCTVTGGPFACLDIGWLTDPNIPLHTLDVSSWKDSTIDGYTIRPGVKRTQFINTRINGVLTNSVIQH